MATSGYRNVTVTSWDTLSFSWTLASQDVAKNTSRVNWKLELISGSDGAISSTAAKAWSVTVNGTRYTGTTTIGIGNNATKTLASGATTIAHNSDGSKTFNYSFSQEFDITFSGSHLGTFSGSGTGSLTTIPRKSTITASNGTLGVAQTLTINRQHSGFTHTVRYAIGPDYWTIATQTSATSLSWTPPIERASYNTTGASINATLTVITYNGDTAIGTSTTGIKLAIPASVKPACSVSVTDPTGHKDTYGFFVHGLSRCKVSITGTPAQGSPIAAYVGYVNGAKYSHQEFTVQVPDTDGTLTVSATVTDRRGRIGEWSGSYNVLEYSSPRVTALEVHRCDGDGTENDQGEFVQATFSAEIAALRDRNAASYTLRYKQTQATAFTEVPLNDLAGAYTVTGAAVIFAADSNHSYDVEIVATDSHSSGSRATSASTAFTLINWHPDGRGMGIGMIAEAEGLAVGIPLNLYGGIGSVAADAAAASRAALGIGKHLWGTASWTSGTITVPELQNYQVFLLKVAGVSVHILATRVGANFRGIGGYPVNNGTRIYSISAVIDGTSLGMTLCNYVLHSASGSHSELVSAGITDIWGLI